MSELDKLPTPEEIAAANEATTAQLPKRKPLEYPVNVRPRSIAIDPVTNAELPPQRTGDDPDEDNRPRRQKPKQTELPEKFKGKSAEEIYASYEQLERKYGSLANELGSVRSVVERLATGKREADLELNEKPVEITSDELLSNPTEAIAKVIAAQSKNSPKVDDEIALIRQEQAMDRFRDRHPEFEQDMGDPEFQKWLSKSQYRQRLAARAAQDGDLDAADELFTGWEEIKASQVNDDPNDTGDDDDDDVDARSRKLRDAHLERGGSRGVSKDFHKRIYSRAELIKLRMDDPDRYYDPAMQEIITKAYLEGRVK